MIDSARTATVPWRLLEGQVLYRDIFLEFGPLEPYVVALAYQIGGVHLDSIRWLGLLLSLGILTLVYKLSRVYLPSGTAFFTSLFVLFVYGFGHYFFSIHIFNFIFPYSLSATIGLLLLLLLLLRIRDFLFNPSPALASWTGFIYALCLLTKLEIALAASVAWVGAYVLIGLRREQRPPIVTYAAGFVVVASVLVAVYLYFLPFIDLATYLHERILPLVFANLSGKSPNTPGADRAFHHLLSGLAHFPIYLLPLLLSWLGVKLHRQLGPGHLLPKLTEAVLAATAALALTILLLDEVFPVLWSVGLITAGALIVNGWRWLESNRQDLDAAYLALTAMTALSFVLRNAQVLGARGYGFYLLVPATIVVFVSLLGSLPNAARLRNPALAPRLVFYNVLIFAVVLALHLRYTVLLVSGPTGEISADRGILRGPKDQAVVLHQLITDLRKPIEQGERVWVIPEGDWISFMLNSTPRSYYSTLSPHFVATRDNEHEVIDELVHQNYDYVVLMQRYYGEFGKPEIGKDFFRQGMAILRERYTPLTVYNSEPFDDPQRFGATLFRRRRDSFPQNQYDGTKIN